MGGRCELKIVRGYPVLFNEEKLTDSVISFAVEYLGKDNVVPVDIWMAAEDFSYYSQVSDTCFYLLGTGNKEQGMVSSLHTSTFNIDEKALTIGIGLMAYLAVKQLETKVSYK